jgi:hypothetical protein
VSMFHMADFEADKGEFDGWKASRADDRKNLLNELLNLMTSHASGFLGTFVDVENLGESTRAEYRKGVVDLIRTIARDRQFTKDDKISIVFARHADFSLEHAEAYRAIVEAEDSVFGSILLDDPARNMPLQAADIFAYELSRHTRPDIPPRSRYPFRFIVENAKAAGAFVRMSLYPEPAAQLARTPARIVPSSRRRRSRGPSQ